MTFRQGLVLARSHIFFLVGLTIAFGLVFFLEGNRMLPGKSAHPEGSMVSYSSDVELGKPTDLSAQEIEWAETAWTYFKNNVDKSTGLVGSVEGFSGTTLWDTASYLLGMISAQRLGIISDSLFQRRVSRALQSLSKLPLYDGKLPNKAYDVHTLKMTDYANKPTARGIGWSAIDIARVMVPINILVWSYPELSEAARAVVDEWELSAMVQDGKLYGAMIDAKGETKLVQEGRIGYEEYAARTLLLMGYDVGQALAYDDYLEYVDVYGFDIPTDNRIPEIYDAHNYVVSESYILGGLEFGLDNRSREYAWRIFNAQRKRFEDTGVLTAVSEDHIDRAPWFVYNTVFTDGKIWNAITDTGEDASEHRALSTKSAIGWSVLFPTDYAKKLIEGVEGLDNQRKGWYSGRYEADSKINKSLTANTNGVILESLHYKQFGPLIGTSNEVVSQ